MADKIKTLKAINTIDAMPQRARPKHASAEEPVTARIRRRKETVHISDPAIQPDAAVSQAETFTPPESTAQDSSIKPRFTFQESIARERQRENQEPSLS